MQKLGYMLVALYVVFALGCEGRFNLLRGKSQSAINAASFKLDYDASLLNQSVTYEEKAKTLAINCIDRACTLSIAEDGCKIATAESMSAVFSEAPRLPMTCPVKVAVTDGTDTVTLDVAITVKGDTDKFFALTMSELGKKWGGFQKSLDDPTMDDPAKCGSEYNCERAYGIFEYNIGHADSSVCDLSGFNEGRNAHWRWTCASGKLRVLMLTKTKITDMLDAVTGNSFLPQAVNIDFGTTSYQFKLLHTAGATAPWNNDFCTLANGRGHLYNISGSFTYYPLGTNIGDNDNYGTTNIPTGVDTCDSNTTPYIIKVSRANQNPFYGYEMVAVGQSIVGCLNSGGSCTAPTHTFVADATVNPVQTVISSAFDCAVCMTSSSAFGMYTQPYLYNLTVENFNFTNPSATSGLDVGIALYASNVSVRNISLDAPTNFCANNPYLVCLTTFGTTVADLALEGGCNDGFVFNGRGLEIWNVSVTNYYEHGLIIGSITAGEPVDVRGSHLRSISKRSGVSRIPLGFSGLNAVYNDVAVLDAAGPTGGSAYVTDSKINNLVMSGIGLWQNDINAATIHGLTYVNNHYRFKVDQSSSIGSKIKSALFTNNMEQGFFGVAQSSLQDALFHSNSRNIAPACANTADGFTGGEYCINSTTMQNIRHEAPIFANTISTGFTFAPPVAADFLPLNFFQLFSRYATNLASTLAAACQFNSGSPTCYKWDLALKNQVQTALNYYTCSRDNAYEILFDDYGNDDGVCDLDEECIWSPNIGAYQGHGNLVDAANCTNGKGKIWKYEFNGR